MPGDGVTVHSIPLNTVANLIASVPEEALFTTILAQRAGETSRTRARACVCIDKITRVLTVRVQGKDLGVYISYAHNLLYISLKRYETLSR